MCFSFGIPIGCVNVSSISPGNLHGSSRVAFEVVFTILSASLFPTKSPASPAVFRIVLFEAVLSASVADFFVL